MMSSAIAITGRLAPAPHLNLPAIARLEPLRCSYISSLSGNRAIAAAYRLTSQSDQELP